jgi:hypothetical protein
LSKHEKDLIAQKLGEEDVGMQVFVDWAIKFCKHAHLVLAGSEA